MRFRVTQVALLAIACLWAYCPKLWAQSYDPSGLPHSARPCPSVAIDERHPLISVAELTFSGSLTLSSSDQAQIAAAVKKQTRGSSVDAVLAEALERTRSAWQDRGYFKAAATGDARTLTSSPVNVRVALDVQVEEGFQYRLGGITFTGNSAFAKPAALRALFPLKDGDLFSTEKIREGLENLRQAYGEFGYINFTPVPDTKVSDDSKLVLLTIDLDEGKPFVVSSTEILGLDAAAAQEVTTEFPLRRGDVFNSRLFPQFLADHPSMFHACGNCGSWEEKLDEPSSTMAIILRPCAKHMGP